MLNTREISRLTDHYQCSLSGSVEIVLDSSVSMENCDGSRGDLARGLAMILLSLAGKEGQLIAMRGPGRSIQLDSSRVERIPFIPFDYPADDIGLFADLSYQMTDHRIVVSDFFCRSTPHELVEKVCLNAKHCYLIQLLEPEEIEPVVRGTVRYRDVETDQELEAELTDEVVGLYEARLQSMRDEYQKACSSIGAMWVSVPTALGLDGLCSKHLVPIDLLRSSPEQVADIDSSA